MQIVNQFSYPIFAIVLGLIIVAVTRRMPRFNRVMRLGVIAGYMIVAIILGTVFQYPDSPSQVETVADVEATLLNEQPTFVMLYSNY